MRIPILIGYAKTDASKMPVGEPVVLPVMDEQEQARIFNDARTKNVFPKGVKWLGFGMFEVQDAAAFMGHALTEQLAGRETVRLTQVKEEYDKAEKLKIQREALANVTKAVSAAAVKHNDAVSALKRGKFLQQEAEANFKLTKAESAEKALETAKQKVAELETLEQSAKSELDEAKKAKADLINPPAPKLETNQP